jgi:hypothetical protein
MPEPPTAAAVALVVGFTWRLLTRVALITIALLAVMAPLAQAWEPSNNVYMHKYEQAAIGLWGSAPDCPAVEYIWLEADPWGEDGVRGRAADCRMWLMDWDRLKGDRWARREGFAWNCFLVLHEWGHLLGYDHDVIEPRHPEIERYCAREAERQYRRLLYHHTIRSRRSCLRRSSCRSSRSPALLSSPSSPRALHTRGSR